MDDPSLRRDGFITLHVWFEEGDDEPRARLVHPPLRGSASTAARGHGEIHRLLERGLRALLEVLRTMR